MKPRHAAALALVVWWLMTPPFTGVGPNPREASLDRAIPDPEAPLSKWLWSGSFESVDACQHEQQKQVADAQKRELNLPVAERDGEVVKDFLLGECIAIDDPRLKGN
jgi:hypothetical protein